MTERARPVSIEGSRVLVTGANRGIGTALVEALLIVQPSECTAACGTWNRSSKCAKATVRAS